MRSSDAQAWFEKAVEDEQVVNAIVLANGPWAMAAYHLQQAAEKYIKAALVAQGVAPPRSHDLVLLLQLSVALAVPEETQTAAALLSSFAWLTRYPGGPTFTIEHVTEGQKNLVIIKQWCHSLGPNQT